METVGNFFYKLQDAYNLLKYGHEEKKLKIYYCPIFPNARIVLQFLLFSNIYFEPHKIDYLHGDFKEDPILVDDELILIEWLVS